jgi:cardiolipin synthase
VRFIQRRLYPRLGRAGMTVYEYQPSMMHSKTMLVDDRLVVVGSINMDFLSMDLLEEGCLVVDDRTFAAELERRWHGDVARSRQVVAHRVGGERRAETSSAGAVSSARG